MKPLFLICALFAFAMSAPAQDAAAAQREATRLYPDLGKVGTSLHTQFLELYQKAQAASDPVLKQPNWPLVLAKQAAAAIAPPTAPAAPASPSVPPAQPGARPAPDASAPDAAAALKGLRTKVPIAFRYAANADGYAKGPFGRALVKFYDGKVSIVDDVKKGLFQKFAEAVEWKTEETMTAYCPKNWDGKSKLGVYINISAGNGPIGLQKGYSDVFDSQNMLYASPSGTGNAEADMRRAALTLDTLATLRKQYPIDETRILVGGISGGGAMSALMAVHYPEFRASICQVRNFYLGGEFCTPYLKPADISAIARRKQAYVFVSGPGDGNYAGIKASLPYWKGYHIESTFVENDLKGHVGASGNALKEAINWALAHSQPPAK